MPPYLGEIKFIYNNLNYNNNDDDDKVGGWAGALVSLI